MEVGITGTGTMGAGIAQAFAQTEGYEIFLCDISEELAAKGKARITKGSEGRIAKRKMTREEVDVALARIYTGIKDICGDCDLVVEAVIENMEVKKQTFKELQYICKRECMLTSSTSSLSITELGTGLDRPATGIYFFNPAPVMKLMEIIVGLNTPAWVAGVIRKTAESIGEVSVQVEEAAGFVVNRLLVLMINEAAGIYAEGIANVGRIDSAMKLGVDHPMGPLALGDLVGLDVVLAIMEVFRNETGDSKCHLHPLLRKMVRGGRLKQKIGIGSYDYRGQKINNVGGVGHGLQFIKRTPPLAGPVSELC